MQDFIDAADKCIKKWSKNLPEPMFRIGDRVKTTGGTGKDYVSLVIGAGEFGTVGTLDAIPLVYFDNGNSYYVFQNKLRKVRKEKAPF